MTTAHTFFRHFTTIWRIAAVSLLMSLAACNNGGGGGSGSADLSLFAGNLDSKGNIDGTGSAARFYDLRGGTFDTAGNLYVADTSNHTIRKITPAGVVTTFAGLSGYAGNVDGTGPLARFNTPFAVAADKANPSNIYVADTYNHTIRKITSAGVVSTLAGSATATFADGSGAAASFNYPQGIATDSAGNVYVADTNNHRIRFITPAGAASTMAGNGTGTFADDPTGTSAATAASFLYPQGIATDTAGNVYVGDSSNHRIRFITPAGAVTTLAGSGTPGFADNATGAAANFNNPIGVATDSTGNVYVADTSNQIIRKVTSAGAVSTLAGTGSATTPTIGSANGTGASASFYTPSGISVDVNNNIFVADTNNRAIRKIITTTGAVSTFAGATGIGSLDGNGSSAGFNLPSGAVSDSVGNLYVVDTNNHIIRKITPSGAVSTYAGRPGISGYSEGSGSNALFNSPGGLAIDNVGNLYVADTGNHRIRYIIPTPGASTGTTSLFAGSGAATFAEGKGASASFYNPRSVVTDSAGNVYVVDRDNQRIRKIIADGTVSTLAGSGTATFADGKGVAASFNGPWGIAIDSTGILYVADRNNHVIRKITTAGDVSTIAGKAGIQGSADGGGVARFNAPQGIATDSNGNVYVTDVYNHTIRKITSTGVVSTVVGVAGQGGFSAGALPGLIAFPEAITFSGSSLYIAMSNGIAVVKNFH